MKKERCNCLYCIYNISVIINNNNIVYSNSIFKNLFYFIFCNILGANEDKLAIARLCNASFIISFVFYLRCQCNRTNNCAKSANCVDNDALSEILAFLI